MARAYQQLVYHPKNPEKYKGRRLPFARSSWEISFMEYFDNNPSVIEWASEPFPIAYVKPTDGKVHRYYPDFLVVYQTRNGEIRRELIEVKPASQARRSRAKKSVTQIVENVTFAVNLAKWRAAAAWCEANDVTFRILTDKGDITVKALGGL